MRYEKSRRALFLVALLAACAPAGAEDTSSDAAGLTFVGIAEQGGVVYVSLLEQATGDRFLPSTKAPDGGYELVAITEDQDAIVRHNGQSYRLRMGVPDSAAPVAEDSTQAVIETPNIPRPGSAEATTPQPPPGTKLPLVFQSGDIEGLDLTDHQKAIIIRLRGQFLAAIGAAPGTAALTSTPSASENTAPAAASSSPASPTHTWISAQEQSDEIFRMLFGTQAFNAYEMGLGTKP